MERRVSNTVAKLIQKHRPTHYLRIEDFETICLTAINHSSIKNFINDKSDEDSANHFILYVLTWYKKLQAQEGHLKAFTSLIQL